MFPYYLLPNAGDTQEPDEDQQPEPEATESQSWLPSYISVYVNPNPPAASPQSPHLEYVDPPSPPSMPSTAPEPNPMWEPLPFGTGSSPVAAPDYTQPSRPAKVPTGQPAGQEPDSSGQGNQNKGEGTPDIGDTEAGDYPSEEPELPHVTAGEAYTDLYHMADHLRLMGRAYRDSSPDALGVMGDGLRRPFTYSTIFQHFPSCRRSLEFIYADPLDVDGCPVIDFARRLWQGGGYGGSRRGDVEETFSLDDVRQFTEINLATETFDGDDAVRYEKMLNAVFGYVIDFNDKDYGYSPEAKIRQLQNLAKANVHIVDYLEDIFVDDDDRSGLSVFKQYFSESEYGQLKVSLGDDKVTGGAVLGRVPLRESTTENLDSIFLGSLVDIPTIVHEFAHVISRSRSIVEEYSLTSRPWNEWYEMTGLVLNDSILQYGIVGFEGKQNLNQEFWADLFMTAVLDSIIDGPLTAYSSTYGRIRNLVGREFDTCGVQVGQEDCDDRPIQWVEEENYRILYYTMLPKDQFPILLRSLLSG